MSVFDWWKSEVEPVDAGMVALDQDMRAPAHAKTIPNATFRAWLDFFVSWRNWCHRAAGAMASGWYVPFVDPAQLEQWKTDLRSWRSEFERLTGAKPSAPPTGSVENPTPSAWGGLGSAASGASDLIKWGLVALVAWKLLDGRKAA